MTSKLTVKFWGVRGSIPCPGPGMVRYGGNTACVEVRCGDRLIIFDGGTGMREFGDALLAAGGPIDADIFLSHCHIDHIGGLPFFAPLYAEGHRFRLWAGNLVPPAGIKSAMHRLMSTPLFPIGIDAFKARVEYRDFAAGATLDPFAGATLRTAPLDHPGGATGYRLDFDGRSIAYLTDNEEPLGDFDPALLALTRGADLAIYDCTYTDDEIDIQTRLGPFHLARRAAACRGRRRQNVLHLPPCAGARRRVHGPDRRRSTGDTAGHDHRDRRHGDRALMDRLLQ